jgi:hypothetical protein
VGLEGEAIAIAIEKGVNRGLARIEAARRFRGLNQSQLAKLAGVSRLLLQHDVPCDVAVARSNVDRL